MHKAIFIIQMKLEAKIIYRHPEYRMDDRMILDMIDYNKGTVEIEGKTYELNSNDFPTIDTDNPFILTEEEKLVVKKLKKSFEGSLRLNNHVRTLYSKGSIYSVSNSNHLHS